MDGTDQALQTGFFGLGLWFKCALAGTTTGAAVAIAQVFPGRWHPAWARRLIHWFVCPLFAGLAVGVVIALRGVPPLSEARLLWLVLCLAVTGTTALASACAVAFLSRNHDPDVVSKSKRAARRSSMQYLTRAAEWENRLRALFRPPPTAAAVEKEFSKRAAKSTSPTLAASVPGQRVTLPPARGPQNEVMVRVPTFPGRPSQNVAAKQARGDHGADKSTGQH